MEEAMFYFRADYDCFPHPDALRNEALSRDLYRGTYGDDGLTREAKQALRRLFDSGDDMDFFFVPSGSAANKLGLATLCGPSANTVICTQVAHIHVHERSSIRGLGYDMKLLNHENGQFIVDDFERNFRDINPGHSGVWCLSNATEWGTAYEVARLHQLCAIAGNMPLHIDGARLANVAAFSSWRSLGGFAQAVPFATLSLGMAKNGGVGGDLLVVRGEKNIKIARELHKDFCFLSPRVQRDAVQALALFNSGLWLRNGQQANTMATRLANELRELGIQPLCPVQTNAVFVHLSPKAINILREREFGIVWDEEKGIVRLMCSYSTRYEHIEQLLVCIKAGQR